MRIAIVILNWNGRALLEKFLPSILEFSKGKAEVYVADNKSSDDSVSFLEEKYPEVKLIQNKSNGGYAKGYNDALKEIQADVYALVNSDIEVTVLCQFSSLHHSADRIPFQPEEVWLGHHFCKLHWPCPQSATMGICAQVSFESLAMKIQEPNQVG